MSNRPLRTTLRTAGLLVLVCMACASAGASAAQPDPAAAAKAVRDEFLDGMRRVRLRLPDTPDSPALKAYVIYDYLLAARLRRNLAAISDDSLDASVDGFLQTHQGQPVGRALKHDWLVSLAQRGRWDWFLTRSTEVSDPLLICDRLAGQLATGDTAGLAAAALVRWGLPQRQPPQCNPVFAWLKETGRITAAAAESRARAALLADNPRLAREAAAEVPAPRALAILRWSDLLEAPKSALTVLASHPALPIEADALAAGFDKLARSDFDAAAALLPQLLARGDMTPALGAHLRRATALSAAYARDPRALAAFTDLPPEALDGQVEEWRVRAALWNGSFAQGLAWMETMPATLATQPRWRYWRARAVDHTAGPEAAAGLYAPLAKLRDYYGYLAADRLHESYQLNAHASPDDGAAQAALAETAGMQRAHELFDCDMADEASAEWAQVLAGVDSKQKVQAAQLAAHWGWYAQAIATLAQSGEFDDVALRYPRPFLDSVENAAKLARLPADWIFGVMRQESLFRKDAVSHADARGLMQMLPSTAAAVARRWHLTPPGRDDLFDPAVAVPLGAIYLRELLDRYDNRLPLALAAYNAGSGAVERWLPSRSMDAAIWVENIPYNETRNYVQHILEHIVAFAAVRGAEPPSLTALLAEVGAAAPAL